jgi:TfoX/Sxy family transcriptional regulator of competence genes
VKIPSAAPEAVAQFESLAPVAPDIARRVMFGQPVAFLNGNMFFGVHGDRLFLRLSTEDRAEAAKLPGVTPFEPMPGRPMKEYVVLPPSLVRDGRRAREWIGRSTGYVRGLPPKKPKR